MRWSSRLLGRAANKGLEVLHGRSLFGRRVRILCQCISTLIPPDAAVLDIGCGDGSLAELLMRNRPDIQVTGIDTLVRPQTAIPILPFNGHDIEFADSSFDVTMFVDVLHHADSPLRLLREAARVSRGVVIIKDHLRAGFFAQTTLRFMDYVGNARHGVSLPYRYFDQNEWNHAFQQAGLRVDVWENKLDIYPAPANLVFERSLHFVSRLTRTSANQN